jgi:hypothetical protein
MLAGPAAATDPGAQAPATAATPAPLRLGVATRFGQGWPARQWRLLAALPAVPVREAVSWRAIESVPGRYQFTPATIGPVDRLCREGHDVMLSLLPRHPGYGGPDAGATPAGRAAFARYVEALASHLGRCLVAVEIGNEINGVERRPAIRPIDRAAQHGPLLTAVRDVVKRAHPDLVVLGGSTNVVATGFLVRLARGGDLDAADAIAIHPYRHDAAGLDWELAHLRASLGPRAPGLWATEFGWDKPDEAAGADYLVQMAMQLSAAGVAHAYWFQLVDDPQFPRFGLYRADGEAKPVARAFTYLVRSVLPRGPAVREGPGEGGLYLYRLGGDRQVIWGAPRALRHEGALTFRDAQGRAIPAPDRVTDRPVIAEGSGRLLPGPAEVLADSLYDYGRAPWLYWLRRGGGATVPLRPVDGRFATRVGTADGKTAAINPRLVVIPPGVSAIGLRYVAPRPLRVHVSACLAAGQEAGPAAFTISAGGAMVAQGRIGPAGVIDQRVDLDAGAPLDIAFRAEGAARTVAVRYRLRLSLNAGARLDCGADAGRPAG